MFATASKIFIVVELVEGGELFEHLVERKVLPEDEARFFFHQIVDGLMYCQNAGICHRDLKPENLLLDKQGILKISDFGLSTLYVGDAEADGQQRAELLHTTCGTPNYVAPEVLESRGYDGKSADVWSVGVILFVLLAGYLPFEEETMPALFSKIKQADFAYPMWFTPAAKALLSGILVPNPAGRFTLTDVFNHPWMQGPKTPPSFSFMKAAAAASAAAAAVLSSATSDPAAPPPASALPVLPIPPTPLATTNQVEQIPPRAITANEESSMETLPQQKALDENMRPVNTIRSTSSPAVADAVSTKSVSCLPFLCGSGVAVKKQT